MTSKLFVSIAILNLMTPGAAFADEGAEQAIETVQAPVSDAMVLQESELSSLMTRLNAVTAQLSDPVMQAATEDTADPAVETSEAEMAAEAVRARIIAGLAKPASLTSFDGGAALLKKAGRRRIVLSSVGYTLTVGSDGKPTACEVAENYRQKYTGIALCNVLKKHHTFQPARDAQGNAVEGTYENRLFYRKLREEIEAAKLAEADKV